MAQIPDHVQKAELGLDHMGRDVSTDNPIERQIRAISPDISRVELAQRLDPILKIMATRPVAEGDALLYDCIKKHFALPEKDIKSYKKDLDRYRKSNKETVAQKPRNQAELIELLKKEEDCTEINPAQDFHDGKMYFTILINKKRYLLTPNSEVIDFDDAEQKGLTLRHKEVDIARFSSKGITRFLEGDHDIDTPELYNKIRNYITRFVFFVDDRLASYLTLWVMGTYLFKVFRYYPYVWINAEKQSGKSLLMRVLAPIAFNGEVIMTPTPAVVFRRVANDSISMFIDEMERARKQDKDIAGALISILNSGFEDDGYVERTEKGKDGNYRIVKFPAYSPKMFAGINDIDDVLQDRTVRVKLLRKKEDECVERYKKSGSIIKLQREIRDELYEFALKYAAYIARLYHDAGEGDVRGMGHLTNRELDIWESIFILANLIDTGLCSNEITTAMESLSKQSMTEKQEDSVAKNETYQLLTIMKKMLDEHPQEPDIEGNVVYDQESVLQFFINTDEFSWLAQKKKNSLTIRIKKIGIRSEELRRDGEKSRFYVLNKKDLEDLCERFNI